MADNTEKNQQYSFQDGNDAARHYRDVYARQMAEAQPVSCFDGNTLQLIGWRLLGLLLSAVTLGIGFPWADCMIYRWETRHTISNGRRLYFDGKGHQLLGKLMIWGLLTVITFGIYALFIPVNMRKWRASHTRFATPKDLIRRTSNWQIAAILLGIAAGVAVIALIVMLLTGMYAGKGPAEATASTTLWTQATTQPTTEATEATEATLPEGDVYYVTAPQGLNIRANNNTSSEILGQIPYGTAIVPQEVGKYWVYVEYKGITGWCSTKYLVTEPPETLPVGSGQ